MLLIVKRWLIFYQLIDLPSSQLFQRLAIHVLTGLDFNITILKNANNRLSIFSYLFSNYYILLHLLAREIDYLLSLFPPQETSSILMISSNFVGIDIEDIKDDPLFLKVILVHCKPNQLSFRCAIVHLMIKTMGNLLFQIGSQM